MNSRPSGESSIVQDPEVMGGTPVFRGTRVASLLKLRHKTLLAGLQQLLNDPNGTGIVKALYQHALINPMTLVVNAKFAGSSQGTGANAAAGG